MEILFGHLPPPPPLEREYCKIIQSLAMLPMCVTNVPQMEQK